MDGEGGGDFLTVVRQENEMAFQSYLFQVITAYNLPSNTFMVLSFGRLYLAKWQTWQMVFFRGSPVYN